MTPKSTVPQGYCHFCEKVCGLFGFCHCGCGAKTKLARLNQTRKHWIKRLPLKTIAGHGARIYRPPIRFGALKGNPVAYIPLTKGKWAVVDRKNVAKVKPYYRQFHNGYAISSIGRRTVGMHMLICQGAPEVDHHDHNRLNNREENLRPSTIVQNRQNSLHPIGQSGYRGVTCNGPSWAARIKVAGVQIHLGSYCTRIEAAKSYDKAASKYHGEFAILNFPFSN